MKRKFLSLLLVMCMVISLLPVMPTHVSAYPVVPSVGDTVNFIDADWMCIGVDTDDSDGYSGYKLLRNDPLEMVNFDEDSDNFVDSDIYGFFHNIYLTSNSIFSGELSSIMRVFWSYGTVTNDELYTTEFRMGLLTLTEYNAIKGEDWYVPLAEGEKWWLATSDSPNICTAVNNEGSNSDTRTAPHDSAWARPSLWLDANTSFVLTEGKYVATYPFTTPGFNPAEGNVTFPRDITISGYGADHVYYTTDGTPPATSTTGSTIEYTGPITINSNVTIRAISTKTGYYPSSVATATYTQEASFLTGLVLSGTPTGFTFAAGTLTYNSVKVANDISSVTVTPTGAGTITVNGTEVASGTASVAIPLTVGEEESISVVVAQAGKSTTTYTINVTRRSNIWDGVTTTEFTGSGLEADPYIIDTAEKLAYLATQVNGGETYNGMYFKMTADISLNDTSNWQTWDNNTVGLNEWTPIGDYENVKAFEGYFDGNGHVVKGIYINSESNYRGLFSYTGWGSVIKNLGIAESYIHGGNYVGGIVGGGINTTVQNCYNTAKITGENYVGGLIGEADRGTVKRCYNSGSISGTDFIGGIAGTNLCTVENSYNTALIVGENYIGGIVGRNIIVDYNFAYGTVKNCYNIGGVRGASNVGGIAGKNENSVEYCYWLITAEQTVGGTAKEDEDKLSIGDNSSGTQVFSFTEAQGQGTEPTAVINGGGTYANKTSLIKALKAYNADAFIYSGIWFAAPSLSVNDGYPVLTGYSGGTGSEEDPYLISTADDLRQLSLTVNSGDYYSNKYFKMTADISLNDTSDWQSWVENTVGLNEWTPIGYNDNFFYGFFDGDGHTVSGVYISDNESDNTGFFGYVGGGYVKNLGVTQSFINGNERVGGVAGSVASYASIEYCWFSGTLKGKRFVGGVAGLISFIGTAQYCFNTGTVEGWLGVGGVFGVTGECSISKCYNAGTVSGGYAVGGVSGAPLEITHCYNSGVVTGVTIPGLVDMADEFGITGTSPHYVGAIAGDPGYVEGCFYDKQMSGEAGAGGLSESTDVDGTIGKLTTEMCDVSFDDEFGEPGEPDVPDKWVFENGLYPRLVGMETTDASLVSAMPVWLPSTSDTEFEISQAVKSDFIVGTSSGVGWASGNNSIISIDEGSADITCQSIDTTVILTAAKNNVSKQVPLKVMAVPPAISPTNLNYDLNDPADVTTTITWNTASLITGIAHDATTLEDLEDYSISDNTLTVANDFIAGLSPALNDEINFDITFNTGDTATLTVNVVDSTVPVTSITGVPTTVTAGAPLTLTGTVAPADATNQTIVWGIVDAGTTNATISGNTLSTSATGTVTVRATIINGLTSSSDYIQNFAISVSPIPTGTVTFNSDGAVYVTKTVNIGESIGSVAWPADPTQSGYTFGGWFTGENGTGTEFTSATQVDSTITVYAKWTLNPPEQYTVSFETNGGTAVSPITLNSGTQIETAPVTTKEGFSFVGWYTDSGFNTEFDFDTPIVNSIILYAKWTVNPPEQYTVSFETNGGTAVTPITLNSGTQIVTAPVTTKTWYSFTGWYIDSEFNTEFDFDTPITNNITLYAKWTYSGGGGGGGGGNDNTPPTPQKTITVTETSSEIFKDTSGTISATANMENAFSNSVEVKVTDTAEDVVNFKLSAGDEVYPFDISLYIKGTNTRTKPAPGYAVTILLPIPENLLDEKELLAVMHKSDDGKVTTLNSRLVQKNDVWYLAFEATEFSPYALVVRNSGNYDESSGVPYYTDSKGNKVFIGFAANGKYIAPEGVTVSFMQNDKSFSDLIGHWAASQIGFTTERELFFGTDGNKFSPNIGMTRGMFTTVIGRLYERSFGEITSTSIHSFIDCDYGIYYGKYVDWAAENKIISGVGGSKFAPDTLVTREQMAAILYRFADFLKVLPNELDTSLEYPDEASISNYAKNAALYCQTTDIIAGRSGGVFAPQETATRAEVSIIIKRFIETVMK